MKNIVRELSGEKIDIIRWSNDPKIYVTNALSPAKLQKVTIDPDNPGLVHVVAESDQLSLAIGKRGQNVRLTAKLVGVKIDIQKDEAEVSFAEKVMRAVDGLASIEGISRENAETLVQAGFLSVEGILALELADLAEAIGLSEEEASVIADAAAATQVLKRVLGFMRVHELAKQLGIPSKECVGLLIARGVDVKSHMSAVDEGAAERFLADYAKASATKAGQTDQKPASLEKKTKPSPKAAKAASPEPDSADPVIVATPAKDPVLKNPTPARPADSKKAAVPEKAAAPEKSAPHKIAAPGARADKIIHVKGAIAVADLAKEMGVRPNVVITELMKRNVLASINQTIDINIAREIAELYGFSLTNDRRSTAHHASNKQHRLEEAEEEDAQENLVPRAPVITFLGHVDHGKTSLVDYIRDTHVAAGEHGGITQHIGAYSVGYKGHTITILDTPGHAAFTAMRARGANLTDIAVVVIAADDGIMPQTREAIQHVQAAGVELMVAINKIDLPNANPDRVMQQLQAENLAPEEWGGSVICCPVSAATGAGIDHLLEMLLLQAEVQELKANPKRRAKGYVVEAQLEQGRGATANILVIAGTLRVGDFVLCGEFCGKVKAMMNDRGEVVKTAGPSLPVKMLGLSGVPEAGAEFRVYANEKAARTIASEKAKQLKAEQLAAPQKASLENLFEQLELNNKAELKLVLKADTQGSLEAIQHSLEEIKSEKITLNIILAGTGNISENDVMLASASNAVVLGFHVGREPGVDSECKREGVDARLHHVIYELLNEVREAMTGLIAPEYKENLSGTAEVLQIFDMGKNVQVAGCRVIKGAIHAKDRARVRRAGEVLFEGRMDTLRHFQDQVNEVREAQECGIRLDGFNAFKEGDQIDFYVIEELARAL
ncbi:MAG: translation initiation factor IF-2 [Verrucomicrobia bacterium]|nr:translation initiation factor IF-2 [Verrucomicrobiota bacterium]